VLSTVLATVLARVRSMGSRSRRQRAIRPLRSCACFRRRPAAGSSACPCRRPPSACPRPAHRLPSLRTRPCRALSASSSAPARCSPRSGSPSRSSGRGYPGFGHGFSH